MEINGNEGTAKFIFISSIFYRKCKYMSYSKTKVRLQLLIETIILTRKDLFQSIE